MSTKTLNHWPLRKHNHNELVCHPSKGNCYEKNMEVTRVWNVGLPFDPATPLLGKYPQGKMLECQKDIALLWSLLHNSQKPRTTSTGRVSGDWMRQMQPTHAVEYYLNIRILFCNSWKHTLACCVKQNKFNTERQKLHDLMHFWNLNADLIEVEARMVVTRVGDFRLPEGGRKVGQWALSCTWKQKFWCSTSQEDGER